MSRHSIRMILCMAGWVILLFGSTGLATADELLKGSVGSSYGPVGNARVRVPGTAALAQTDRLGNFLLPLTSSHPQRLIVTAGKEGWFTNGVRLGARGDVSIRLNPVPRVDDPAYRFISPVQCAQCHNTLARYWDQSKMAHTTSNPKVVEMYAGTSRTGGKGIGYKTDNPGWAGDCLVCHAPSTAVRQGGAEDLLAALRSPVTEWDGVSCDYCHKIRKIVSDPSTPSHKKPLFRRMQAKKSNSILVFGPYDDVVNGFMAASYAPIQKKSVFCATCHDHFVTPTNPVDWQPEKIYSEDEIQQFELNDPRQLPVQSTYREWKLWQSGLAGGDPDRGKTCQSCHMSWRKDMLPYDEYIVDGRVRQMLGTRRDPATIHPHQFDGTTSLQLKSALSLELEAEVVGKELRVKAHITNVGAGHWVPTGESMRSVMLVVSGADSQGTPLSLLKGELLPDWTGKGEVVNGNYQGLAGAVFAKTLIDREGHLNVPSWRAVAIASDTRIRPKTRVTKQFVFQLADQDDEPSVEGKLIYRPAFKELAESKGWKDMDITLVDKVW